jgi:hypothetical protein
VLRIPLSLVSAGAQTLGLPATQALISCVSSGSAEGPDGFPRIPETSFQNFRDYVPHLFARGSEVLGWLDQLEGSLAGETGLEEEGRRPVAGAVQALRTMVQTAAVTAPPDLWLMRQILAAHARTGLLERLEAGEEVSPPEGRVSYDLQFLWSRGLLEYSPGGYVRSPSSPIPLHPGWESPDEFRTDLAGLLCEGFKGSLSSKDESLIERWLEIPKSSSIPPSSSAWLAGPREMETGYRLLPTVLGLHSSGALNGLKAGSSLPDLRWRGPVGELLTEAGLLESGLMNGLGTRVLKKGPGIFGIIGAYHTYMSSDDPWVERGKNIAASRDANRASFEAAVEIIGAAGLRPMVVIEHALGLGIGIQSFLKKFGGQGMTFVGADYEEAALEGARREQAAGRLPPGMEFVQADIGRPAMLLDFLKGKGIDPRGAVMIVGNGFHEARGKSDEEMVALLRLYREAGIIVVFTEESGLTGAQIRAAAWNTYHAGFRYTHQISGQRPKPPWPMDPPGAILSWLECFERAGYRVPREYRRGTRTIFPCDLPEARNPPISVTFLCMP